ncbi:MAG: adenine nucleotide alpha hydrolase [Acidobacteriaceae bacterium]|nr:adenine nucleotide alpha hydrolase [Acidobacteriaceae bacterium]
MELEKKTRAALSWSSGKDSAWALKLLRETPDVEIAALITTFNCNAGRVAMHAVRRELVHAQADRAGLRLWPVELPWPCSNAIYEDLMREVCQRAVAEGVTAIAFGDLFLEDIRAYREKQLQGTGLEPLFPVWHLPTRQLAEDMIRERVKAKVTCIDPKKLDRSFAGREFDTAFIEGLPQGIDPCGEYGEFHTFVYEAPVFSRPMEVETGDIVERDGFVFADVKAL